MKEIYNIGDMYIHIESEWINIVNIKNFCLLTFYYQVDPEMCKFILELTKKAVRVQVDTQLSLLYHANIFLENKETLSVTTSGNRWLVFIFDEKKGEFKTFLNGANYLPYSDTFKSYNNRELTLQYNINQMSTIIGLFKEF